MVMVMMVVVDDHLLLGWHRVLLFHRKGRDGEAKRNQGRQGNSKLLHGISPGNSPNLSVVQIVIVQMNPG